MNSPIPLTPIPLTLEPETTTNAPTAAGCARVDTPNQAPVTAAIAPALSPIQSSRFNVPGSTVPQLDVGCSMLDVGCSVPAIHPVQDIAAYLATRKPVAHFEQERSLYIALPDELREELAALFAGFDLVDSYVKAGLSVQKSCQQVFASIPLRGSWKTFRADYDLWKSKRDWVCMVNRAKAGAAWQDRNDGLPADFLAFTEKRIARFARADGQQKALESIQRQWRTGRNPDGEQEPIPGYGNRPMTLNGKPVTGGYWQDWFQTDGYKLLGMDRRPLPEQCPAFPRGWNLSNIRRQIKARGVWTAPVKLLVQQGVSAAKEVLPYHLRSRRDLRFLEEVTFDDVRTDWLIRDTATGEVYELWLLIARDQATAMALGFVMHMSVVREDGSKPHLGLKEMKQLAAWLLERYPLPPYECHWIIERGTATLSEGSARALAEMLPSQITIHYTSMIGGTSPAGYQEKKKGNSRGKASHESHNRIIHTATSYLPGQTGSRWDIRPADLNARVAECVEYWKLSQRLPEHLRGQVRYSLLDWTQAKEHLFRILLEQNFRDAHHLEGFDRVVEWLDQKTGKWMPQNTYPGRATLSERADTIPTRTRMEMPVERAIKLMAPYAGQWKRVSPDIIIAFLSHTAKTISKHMMRPSGEIVFTYEKKDITFAPPMQPCNVLTHVTSALGYYAPDDPRFLHVTNGHGAVLGTWYRRDRNGRHDHDLVEQAMRYTATALKAAQDLASQVTADTRAEADAIRLHNADLERGNEYLDVTETQLPALTRTTHPATTSPVASALTSVPRQRQAIKDEAKQRAADFEDARETLRNAML